MVISKPLMTREVVRPLESRLSVFKRGSFSPEWASFPFRGTERGPHLAGLCFPGSEDCQGFASLRPTQPGERVAQGWVSRLHFPKEPLASEGLHLLLPPTPGLLVSMAKEARGGGARWEIPKGPLPAPGRRASSGLGFDHLPVFDVLKQGMSEG